MQPAQTSYLLQKVAPLVMRELGPHITNRLAPILAQKVGIPIAKKIGLPIVKRVGIPLARKTGTVLLNKFGYPLINEALKKVNLTNPQNPLTSPNTPPSGLTIDNTKKLDPVQLEPKKKRRSLKEMIRPIKSKKLKAKPIKSTPLLPAPVNPVPIAPPKVIPTQPVITNPTTTYNRNLNQGPNPYSQHNNTTLFRTRRDLNNFGYQK